MLQCFVMKRNLDGSKGFGTIFQVTLPETNVIPGPLGEGKSSSQKCTKGWGYVSSQKGCKFTLPETNNSHLEKNTGVGSDEFPFGFRPPARCELLVLESVSQLCHYLENHPI